LRKCMKQLAELLAARDTCIYTQTYEEEQFVRDICQIIAQGQPYDPKLDRQETEVFTFSRFEGLVKIKPALFEDYEAQEKIDTVNTIPKLFHFIEERQKGSEDDYNGFEILEDRESEPEKEEDTTVKSSVFILKDLHLFFDKDTIRAIRDLKENTQEQFYCPIIVTAPCIDLPCELEKIFTYFEYQTMDLDDIMEWMAPSAEESCYDEEDLRNIARSCVGLTEREIVRAFNHSKIRYNKHIDTRSLQEEKIQIVKKSGALDFLVPKQTIEDTGGYQNLKTWIRKLKSSLDPRAKAYGVPQPKGAMFVGLPGNGKTMAAEVIANYLNVPLLQLDLARIMGSFVGQSERQIANALRLARACAPCVMLVDESEKLFGGYQSSSNTDSGTLSRVLAQLLQFLQEEDTGVITIMTSNNVLELPPELTRSGRLDAQWYFGFPSTEERKEIFAIYLRKNELNVPENVLRYLVGETKNYSGAEIKEIVKNIVINAFYRQAGEAEPNRDIVVDDAKKAVASVIPVYISSEEKIKGFIKLAQGRYLDASAEAV